MTLTQLIESYELQDKLLTESQTRGFIAAMASAPYLLEVNDWLPFLWGGAEQSPFSNGEQLEQYIQLVVTIWNETGPELVEGTWQWPEACKLDDEDIVTEDTREFCEGMLQGWQLCRDDWETLMPEESEDNALLGGVLLSISMLYDPLTSLATLKEQGLEGLDQFEEIFRAIPMMLCGITQRGQALAQAENS
ncbi:YecA family protein [Vibrio sp. FNV 38]|nr:YecA family protein [Vibrio sp. FNV 38]